MKPMHELGQAFIHAAGVLAVSAESAGKALKNFMSQPAIAESYASTYVLVFETEDGLRLASPVCGLDDVDSVREILDYHKGKKWRQRRAFCARCGSERHYQRYRSKSDRKLEPHVCVDLKPLQAAARGWSCP